jgi:general stress protein 26
MKISEQGTIERTQLAALIEPIPVALLTLENEERGLIGRPMAPLEMMADGSIWFLVDQRAVEREYLGMANLGFVDHDTATYVSISGYCELVSDPEHITQLWTESARPWFPDGTDTGYVTLLKFTPENAEYWDAPHSRTVRLFAKAASIVTGKRVGLGVHDTLGDLH